MAMDGFTLGYLQQELSQVLTGGRVDRINQPEKDALLLLIRSGGNHRLLLSANPSQPRAQRTSQSYENPAQPPMFCMLMRKHLLGARITAIRQVNGDRILALDFDALTEMGDHTTKTLYLEVMGRYSNLTLVNGEGIIIDAIRHVNSDMSRVRTLLPGVPWQLPPQPDKLVPGELTAESLAERFQGKSLPLWKALCEQVAGMAGQCAREVCAQCGLEASLPLNEMDPSYAAHQIAAFLGEKKAAPVTLFDETGTAADFFPFPYLTYTPDRQKPMASLSEAMDAFYLGRDLRMRMQQRSAGLRSQIKTALERVEKKQAIMEDTLARSGETEQDRIRGDLLTANLYAIPRGAKSVRVQNYYEEGCPEVEIPLSELMTPNGNAQSYYKKYRKAKAAQEYAAGELETLKRDAAVLENALDDLEKSETTADLSEIRQVVAPYLHKEGTNGGKRSKKPPEGKPYQFHSPEGTLIEVGKNAIQNDRLTLHARGEEMWLHAQGIPGSHVIVRFPGRPSDETLLYAAKLAACFSKGRKQPHLPVDYTLRKYVKKGAGSPPGLVTYTEFKTLFIDLTPEEEAGILKAAAEGRG